MAVAWAPGPCKHEPALRSIQSTRENPRLTKFKRLNSRARGPCYEKSQTLREADVPATIVAILCDERGALLTMELILVATIVGLGSIVGLTAFRDSVSQEFGDVSAGLASIDHGYAFNDLEKDEAIDNMRFAFFHSGSNYTDESNFCEPATLDPVNDSPMCMEFSDAFIRDEGEALR